MKRKRWIVILGVITILAICILGYNCIFTSPIQKILNGYGGFGTGYSIMSLEEAGKYLLPVCATDEQKALLSGETIIKVNFTDKFTNQGMPNEVYAIFECFLYLQREQKASDTEIAAICCQYSSGVIDDVDFKHFCITKEEFQALYDQIDVTSKNIEELALQLGDAWINRVHYNRDGLKYSPETEYRKNLGTWWHESYNIENNRQIKFYGNPNKIMEHGPYGNGTEIDVSEESGHIYFTWDEKGDIWIYGKTIGLRKGLINRLSEPIEDSEPPEPLKRVMETVILN